MPLDVDMVLYVSKISKDVELRIPWIGCLRVEGSMMLKVHLLSGGGGVVGDEGVVLAVLADPQLALGERRDLLTQRALTVSPWSLTWLNS
jgi:hypothetical protein